MIKKYSPKEAHSFMKNKEDDYIILDVREGFERAAALIEDSLFIPMNQIPGRINELEEHKEKTIVCYCAHGMRSQASLEFLECHGFTKLINIEGGIARWSQEVNPILATA